MTSDASAPDLTDRPAPELLDLPPSEQYRPWLTERTDRLLAEITDLVADLKSAPPSAETLRLWNEVELRFGAIASVASLVSEVHPDAAVREAAEDAEQRAAALDTELSLDVAVYAALAAVDLSEADELTRRFSERVLRSFRRSGVDLEESARHQVAELNARLVELGQRFSRNIRTDTRTVTVTPDRLAGLPADWVAAHAPNASGLVTITTDYPDSVPVRTFADDADLRREITAAALNVGWPANDEVLRELFDLRAELAGRLGYANWADYDAETKMIGTGAAIGAFIDRIAEVAEASARADRDVLLARLRQDRPEASTIDGADTSYYGEVVQRENFGVDAQQARRYFDFTKVRDGLLQVTGRLFGLAYRPVDVPLWHVDAQAYEVVRATGDQATAGEVVGRIVLDLHPRADKYKHAAQFSLVGGLTGRQLPEGVLVCNLPTGLMDHDQVITLFHEFGHLVHHLLAGRTDWYRFSGVATEWDFVEAPSQLLEEWAWDPAVLASFATDEAGQPIPADLVAKMRAGEDFGKGYQARTQMFYAALAYRLHLERPADITRRTRELQQQYSMFPTIEGTHFACSFGHLHGYATAYYTYMWSLVIAKDLFSAFDPDDLLNPEVAARYRDAILAPGGSKDAADLVADFLGRPYSFDAYAAWLGDPV